MLSKGLLKHPSSLRGPKSLQPLRWNLRFTHNTKKDSECKIIHFKLTSLQAMERLKKWNREQMFAPQCITDQNVGLTKHLIPFWTFDLIVKTTFLGEVGNRENVAVWNETTRSYQTLREVQWKAERGTLETHYSFRSDSSLLHYASHQFPISHAEIAKLGVFPGYTPVPAVRMPWHAVFNRQKRSAEAEAGAEVVGNREPLEIMKEALSFEPEAHCDSTINLQNVSVDSDEAWTKVSRYIERTETEAVHRHLKQTHMKEHERIASIEFDFQRVLCQKLYVPVYVCDYIWDGRHYKAYVNGVSGEVLGDRQFSVPRVSTLASLPMFGLKALLAKAHASTNIFLPPINYASLLLDPVFLVKVVLSSAAIGYLFKMYPLAKSIFIERLRVSEISDSLLNYPDPVLDGWEFNSLDEQEKTKKEMEREKEFSEWAEWKAEGGGGSGDFDSEKMRGPGSGFDRAAQERFKHYGYWAQYGGGEEPEMGTGSGGGGLGGSDAPPGYDPYRLYPEKGHRRTRRSFGSTKTSKEYARFREEIEHKRRMEREARKSRERAQKMAGGGSAGGYHHHHHGHPSASEGYVDLYAVLGVKQSANLDEIKAAFRKQAMIWHPDRHGSEAEKKTAQERFKLVIEAYKILKEDVEGKTAV